MWKGKQRKHHLNQMFTKLIYLAQVSVGKTDMLKHRIPNTFPLKPVSEITPFHDRRVQSAIVGVTSLMYPTVPQSLKSDIFFFHRVHAIRLSTSI